MPFCCKHFKVKRRPEHKINLQTELAASNSIVSTMLNPRVQVKVRQSFEHRIAHMDGGRILSNKLTNKLICSDKKVWDTDIVNRREVLQKKII